MHPASKRARYIETLSLIGWTHTKNDPWVSEILITIGESLVQGMACHLFHIMQTSLPKFIKYKWHQITKLKCFSSRLVVVFVQYIEAKC